ncbi:MAG: FAD-dependent oxidoreductase [Leptolyngbya sp. SIO1D8]|nr:FAD-dependent oxidoreductase [Leptolyngbya sp. SIO1D8]
MQKRIAIVGGGAFGIDLARALEKKVDVTLIEQRSHFIHTPAMVRAVVNPSLLNLALIPYDNALRHSKIIRGRATRIDGSGVDLADGSRIRADFIVIATGSTYAAPFKAIGDDIEGLRAINERTHKAVLNAKTIAIVGAGAVGVELAGEIAFAMPDKKIVLISNKTTLFPNLPKKFGHALLNKLKAAEVEMILGEKVKNLARLDMPYSGTLTLSNGRNIEADIIFPVIGARANSKILSSLPGIQIGHSNRVKVDQWLRPSELPNVFAAGDVAYTGDVMTISGASRQLHWLKKALLHVMIGKPIKTLKPYTPWKIAPIGVPLGPKKGNSYIFMTFGDRVTSCLKGRLFLGHKNKAFGRIISEGDRSSYKY